MHPFKQSDPTVSPDLDALVAEFAERLAKAAELATIEIGRHIIEDIFARVAGRAGSARDRRAWNRAQRERGRIVGALTKRLLATIETGTRARAREILAHRRREVAASAAADKRAARAARTALHGLQDKSHRRRKPVRPGPPPLDPEQIQRDAEFARLRALLKPATVEPIPEVSASPPVPPPREAARPTTPGEVLRALEKEIQGAVPTLGTLGPERCAAQIGVWAAQVRELRDRLPPDVATTMRPAFRIFIEHLTQLHAAMEVQVVDALEPTFIVPDWEVYIEANRALVEQRAPRISDDKLQVHHRTMLRALVLPHRRNASQEAIAIIEAASRALPPNDPQLQSALRRFASLWKSRGGAAEASVPESGAAPSGNEAAPSVESAPEEPRPSTDEVAETVPPSAEPAPAESEFESPWLK